MMLFDISSAFHICCHRLAKAFATTEKIDLKDYRVEFYKYMLLLIDQHILMFKTYDNPVICIDNKEKPTWRKEIYPMYKHSRAKTRTNNELMFDYADAYVLLDDFLEAITKYSGIKTVSVPRAEADDIILVLAEFGAANGQKVLVLSPDKDFIQLQTSPLVQQYSWLTRKMISACDKSDGCDMDEWTLDHIVFGDVSDSVPRIVDFQKFKPEVEEYLKSKGIEMTPYEFSGTSYNLDEFEQFGGVFDNMPFGPAKFKKMMAAAGGLEPLLESNTILKDNYERNKMLVMSEGIPKDVRIDILKAYKGEPECNIPALADALGMEISDLPEFIQSKHIESSLFDW